MTQFVYTKYFQFLLFFYTKRAIASYYTHAFLFLKATTQTGRAGKASPQYHRKHFLKKSKSLKLRPHSILHLSDAAGEVSKSVICSPSDNASSTSFALSSSSKGETVHCRISPQKGEISNSPERRREQYKKV